ncbi:glucokinase [Candidatus Woesearchaeota archaeon]|nr:glucokinase [Candidatus Woesearchaeota archaeon]
MYYEVKEYTNSHDYKEYVLAADVGGTHTNIGICGLNQRPELVFSTHFASSQIKHIADAINETLKIAYEKYHIEVARACIAVAGVVAVDRQSVKLTNLDWVIKREDIFARTMLKDVVLINDFDAIGYAINIITPEQYVPLAEKKPAEHEVIAIVGAGTGLGKSHLIWNGRFYQPHWSEGAHSDYAASDDFEFEMMQYTKKIHKIEQAMLWEDFVSGQGIVNIYRFLRYKEIFPNTKYTREIDRNPALQIPKLITEYADRDQTCKKTLEIFIRNYAKCCRSFCLDVMALGGLFLAGGIAIKHKHMFEEHFMPLFMENQKMEDVLKRIPVWLITDYNISMTGAAYALMVK